jgi:peptidyl-prolyl cis-trans isomerase A (cyclophilin A)
VTSVVAIQSQKRILPIFIFQLAVGVAALIAAIAGCGSGSSKSPAAKQNAAISSDPSPDRPGPAKVDLENPVVRIETTAGNINVRLDGVHAPGTVRNFLNYANERFYDNTLVHFVDSGNMIVAGGYAVDRTPKAGRTPIRNEAHNGLKNTRGTIAMARDPAMIDSATSQFFINLADAPQRNHAGDNADQYGYCVFGEVIEGLEVADKIAQSPTTNQGGDLAKTPEPPVVIKSVRVVK